MAAIIEFDQKELRMILLALTLATTGEESGEEKTRRDNLYRKVRENLEPEEGETFEGNRCLVCGKTHWVVETEGLTSREVSCWVCGYRSVQYLEWVFPNQRG